MSYDNKYDRFHHNTYLLTLVSYTETIRSIDKLYIKQFPLQISWYWVFIFSHSTIKWSAGRVPSCWHPGRLHWALVKIHNSSQQTPGDWKKKVLLNCYDTYDWHIDYFLSFTHSLTHTHIHLQYTWMDQKENLYPVHDENDENSVRTFIILSLHFLPEESTSIFTVKKWLKHDLLFYFFFYTYHTIYCSNKNIGFIKQNDRWGCSP